MKQAGWCQGLVLIQNISSIDWDTVWDPSRIKFTVYSDGNKKLGGGRALAWCLPGVDVLCLITSCNRYSCQISPVYNSLIKHLNINELNTKTAKKNSGQQD